MAAFSSILPSILACATCLPDRGSQASVAQGNAILFMLVLLAFVLGMFIYTIFSFARKQKRALEQQESQS